MGRLLIAALVALASAETGAIELAEGHDATIGIEAGYVHIDGYPSWTDGAYGKLRYSDDGFVLHRAFLDYRGRLADTVSAHVTLEGYDDGLGNAVDLTEAYVEWRPLPRSATRYRVKLGMFFPRLSLENTDPGWSSPYTLNASAINAWVAEEIRTTGIDLSISHRPVSLGGRHTFSIDVSAFGGNDPAGSLLAWKGWSVHDRQTRPGDGLPLPPVPELQPGGMFGHQEPYAEPLLELDHALGYFVNLEWRMGRQLLVRVARYNNEADPALLKKGQYGWHTEFDHVGIQATLPWRLGLFAQWMAGTTVMGPWLGEWHPVDAAYEASYLMLTRAIDRHRVTLRYDDFTVTDKDEIAGDDNGEVGHAWTVSYQYAFSDAATIALEWVGMRSVRPAFEYFGAATHVTERQAQVAIRLRF
ncbi:MAG: hypothetical protein JJ992_23280 [Planctomycetes bacterium]|nr:hypothetical protein [Planctomycetota bacterium]